MWQPTYTEAERPAAQLHRGRKASYATLTRNLESCSSRKIFWHIQIFTTPGTNFLQAPNAKLAIATRAAHAQHGNPAPRTRSELLRLLTCAAVYRPVWYVRFPARLHRNRWVPQNRFVFDFDNHLSQNSPKHELAVHLHPAF